MSTLYAPRLGDYAAGTMVDHFADWCEANCVQTMDQFSGLPLILEPWQREFFSEALAVNERDEPYWRVVVQVIPRKNGKTTEVGAYAAYHTDQFPDLDPEVVLAAASDKQAGRLYKSVSGFIRASHELSARFHLRDYVGEIARVDGLGTIYRMASNPQAADGYNPSLTVVDELHRWTTPGLTTFWEALLSAGGARKHSQVFVITTAGQAHARDVGILGGLIDANERDGEIEKPHEALTISRDHASRTLVYNYSAPTKSRHDFEAIRLANPASWITDEYLREQAAAVGKIHDAAFLQLHGCVWATDGDTYIDPDAWAALGDGRAIPADSSACIGVDGSFSFDTTVVGWASKAPDGRVDVDARIYSVREEAPHHVLHHQSHIDYEDVEGFIIDRFEHLEIRELVYPQRLFDRSAHIVEARLPGSRIVAVAPQTKHYYDALAAFQRGVMEGIVRHRGDPAIAAHIAAVLGEYDPDRGWRLRKRNNRRPIDAVIAMAFAYWRAAREAPTREWGLV